jgi:hypothetical protein
LQSPSDGRILSATFMQFDRESRLCQTNSHRFVGRVV